MFSTPAALALVDQVDHGPLQRGLVDRRVIRVRRAGRLLERRIVSPPS